MTLPLNIYQNVGGKLLLGTRAVAASVADYFRLYWSPVEAGPYAFVKNFPNVKDKTLYPGNALVYLLRSSLGVLPTDSFYLKATTYKAGVESPIGSSTVTSVPPEGAETNDEMREDLTNISQLFGYNPNTGLWQRVTTDGNGKLETTAVINISGTGIATEAKQDDQITILNSIDAGIPASLGATTAANSMPVALATDQLPLPILDILVASQQTDVPVGTVAADVLQPPAILIPLATRKVVVIQNNSNRNILIGDALNQNHVVPSGGGLRSFSAGSTLSLYARVAVSTATLNVWELG